MATMTTFRGFPLAVKRWFQGLEADKFGSEVAPHGLYDGILFVAETWQASIPLTQWLERHVGESELSTDRRRPGT